MGVGIERCQRRLQLRRRREHDIDGLTELLFRPFDAVRRHFRLSLDAIDAVINRTRKGRERQDLKGQRVVGPQQW